MWGVHPDTAGTNYSRVVETPLREVQLSGVSSASSLLPNLSVKGDIDIQTSCENRTY